eukprot:CAMPEP_0118927590 /NCGR_PEP_ID=MMETSP1169-20130426/5027_1 /TAXON_ID=36882 /ORGANISM="Pyramimonas obovata, Strain CCMP722" /LENGTH=152 /DNA_ID=CAMNT_0006869377 /DNA_START=171 /DNA_END=629 /DNA_ORIENTATION=+
MSALEHRLQRCCSNVFVSVWIRWAVAVLLDDDPLVHAPGVALQVQRELIQHDADGGEGDLLAGDVPQVEERRLQRLRPRAEAVRRLQPRAVHPIRLTNTGNVDVEVRQHALHARVGLLPCLPGCPFCHSFPELHITGGQRPEAFAGLDRSAA